MRQGLGRRRRGDSGAAAVEFAFVLPILLLVVFALIQYGLYFWSMQGGSAAAREAARRAAVGQPVDCGTFASEVQANIDAHATNTPTITRSFTDPADVQVGDDVVVTVEFDSMDFNFPFVPFINDGRVNTSATSRVDYVPDPTIGDC